MSMEDDSVPNPLQLDDEFRQETNIGTEEEEMGKRARHFGLRMPWKAWRHRSFMERRLFIQLLITQGMMVLYALCSVPCLLLVAFVAFDWISSPPLSWGLLLLSIVAAAAGLLCWGMLWHQISEDASYVRAGMPLPTLTQRIRKGMTVPKKWGKVGKDSESLLEEEEFE